MAIVCLSDYDVTPSLVMRGATEAMVAEKPKPKTPPEMTLDGLKAANDDQKVGINIVRRAGEQQPRCTPESLASHREARENFTALAETWTRLAAELDSDEALLRTLSNLEFSEPYYALPQALKPRSWAP